MSELLPFKMTWKDYALLKSWLKHQGSISEVLRYPWPLAGHKITLKRKRLISGMAEIPLYTSEIDNLPSSLLDLNLVYIKLFCLCHRSQVTAAESREIKSSLGWKTAKLACSFRNQMQEIVFGTLPHALHHFLSLCFNRPWIGASLLSRKMLWKCWPAMGWHTPWWSSSRVPWVTSKM